MPARTQPLVISKDRFGNRGVEADKRNFELNNDPNGLTGASAHLQQLSDADQARTGPDMGANLWGQQANALAQVGQRSRAQEQQMADALKAQALGYGYNPALAQLAASTQQAQGMQQSVAHGASGYDLSAANREAAWQNAALGAQSRQQAGVLGAQMQAFGRDQLAGAGAQMRQQDMANRDALQQNAIRQAGLQDQQQSANDAMAQWYLGEQDRLRRAQSNANINFEQQDAANKLGVSNQDMGRRAYDQQLDNRYAGMALSMGGAGASAASAYATSPQEAQTKKRNPEDPYADYG